MIKFLPELDSDYARFPMHHKRWYQPQEKGPKGEPCFVKADNPEVVKRDYVYCKVGAFGTGYYSLMTKVAYVNLYNKIDSLQPGTCGCACNAMDRKAMDEHDDVKRILYGRHMASTPCDDKAEKRTLAESEGMVAAAYAMDNPGEVLMRDGLKNVKL
eukprot:CAMPEP_0201124034 /NCGR_PEP_ID=MMETSP0850-20130426/10128_1 /ASSEMBLY_ACC=CAM_ASM_000622 /TAXON_ID=183588 /ORGANISM="Pseudo-nitzschia fraudulenta, Strain WWA7" /LENGTH=156 /DNA_ID=CAMNT_0047391213 /DNA_START=123 /DNA_END=593 /DNA_ORIENTATION=-